MMQLRNAPQTGQLFTFDALGDTTVRLTVRRATNRISARWSSGKLHIIAPAHASKAEIINFVNTHAATILARRPGLRYSIGQVITLEGVTVTIGRQALSPRKIFMQGDRYAPKILVGTDIDPDSDEATAMISRLMCHMARTVAPDILIPTARAVSDRLGVAPREWTISHGHHTLGKCNSRGVISLSELLVFLPAELKEYIICHELAHLSHFDHSPAFHQTCDRYLGGRERQLIRQLKTYNWQILRK